MLEDIYADLKNRMEKSLTSLARDYQKIRTGRATPALLDGLLASYYGTPTPLNQMASVTVPEARLLLLQPWDPTAIGEIEKVILKSELGLTPQNDGKVIRINIPPLSQERRKELSKLVKKTAEEAKVALRAIRREANDLVKDLKKSKDISEDDQAKAETQIQKITDDFVGRVDQTAQAKEKEILEF
ncbi:MAG: ribosome recycling factor [Deltaproteobacteria bacterium]|jgi:ribosome recycling factor|nr:ribosome recycling factor [Deltaproteobacteria bacterium]